MRPGPRNKPFSTGAAQPSCVVRRAFQARSEGQISAKSKSSHHSLKAVRFIRRNRRICGEVRLAPAPGSEVHPCGFFFGGGLRNAEVYGGFSALLGGGEKKLRFEEATGSVSQDWRWNSPQNPCINTCLLINYIYIYYTYTLDYLQIPSLIYIYIYRLNVVITQNVPHACKYSATNALGMFLKSDIMLSFIIRASKRLEKP